VKRVLYPDDEAKKEKVEKEVKILAKLDHPNILRYHCTWTEQPPEGKYQIAHIDNCGL